MKPCFATVFVLAASLLAPYSSFGLPLDEDYLSDHEDFVDEAAFPTVPVPELDANDNGGTAGFAIGMGGTTPLPLLGSSVLLQIDDTGVPLARVIHGLDWVSTTSFSSRGEFEDIVGSRASSTVTVSVTSAFVPSTVQLTVAAGRSDRIRP